ncbi:PLP-dependent aminotransferase family protein [Shewanella sp. D64]|uniref:MocR-like pyridoxine biosynthesis transcription factor PdxR n=1 Tax=unclassified Shewanella TaxID=196818 RepID=UPI0022BA3223|nr:MULTISPECIES: PLP-dependent aminotransferase family protein [unclassified Shewanella]MEC4725354.1 PLP-dependent aminotransferase family protein [Shewanella sp. D64]MEC4735800.1 PLP-dependent aminotransferase family protein [Shewanella sp. E94]WBJ93229.1 PLP-dependent aminotransferase family protein [Shewanella sp. MTB7]
MKKEKGISLRNWHLSISLDRSLAVSLHLQLVQAVINEVRKGRLLAGTPLPGTRKISDNLGINRKTVVQAFEELLAQGWIETQPRRASFISTKLPLFETNEIALPEQAPFPLSLTESGLEAYALSVSPVKPSKLLFSDGVPDTRLVPFDVLSRAFRRALLLSSRANRLAYDDARGSESLRSAIAEMLRLERGMSVTTEQVCLVRGSQMGIYLSARLLSKHGGCVVMEKLSYPPARAAFESFGLDISYVDQDDDGMSLAALEQICESCEISAVYTTPHHQFPTTSMLSLERRIRLLALSEKYNFIIIEDDYDHEFHFSHKPMLPLASMETAGRVIHIGSLSKILAPGLRLGYMVAPEDFIQRCGQEILLIDRQGNAVTELAVAELMRNGEMKRHIRRALKIYKQRLDHAVERVRKILPMAQFNVPAGGLALWLRFDTAIDMDKLQQDAKELGLLLVLGDLFSGVCEKTHGLRLGYANLNEVEFDQALACLSSAVSKQCQ